MNKLQTCTEKTAYVVIDLEDASHHNGKTSLEIMTPISGVEQRNNLLVGDTFKNRVLKRVAFLTKKHAGRKLVVQYI